MRKRYIFAWTALTLFAAATFLQAQSAGTLPGVSGFPKISCSMSSSHDSLYFRGNDYVPNQITMSVTVRNISADTAKNVVVCMGIDTRFIALSNPCAPAIPFLLGGDSATVTFTLRLAQERRNDGLDTVRAIVTTVNGASAYCERSVWVEHEYFPVFQTLCSKQFTDIVFDDNLNDYKPNPFRVAISVRNVYDGNSDSTKLQYLGTRGVSIDTTDPIGNTPIRELGTLRGGDQLVVEYDMRAVKRINDTTVTLCFQVQGKGGYLRKTYVDTCCVDVFIPAARQAVYDLQCDINTDRVDYVNHKYQPDPFKYEVTIRNVGTANGKFVKAQLLLPPSIELAPGDVITKPVSDDMPTGAAPVTVSWMLRTANRMTLDTVKICVRVYDVFENSAVCCDSVIIDSIRSARFNVACACPDTIRVDAARGVYNPDIFPVSITVKNVGSDYADSVEATIIIQTPDVEGVAPFIPIKRKFDLSGDDKLQVDSSFVFDWMLQALPRAVSGPITIKFKVDAENAPTAECECKIYIPKLDAPDFELACGTTPEDSLHFNPETGLYLPEEIIFTVRISNPGGGVAKGLKATLALPPRVLLATGESLEKVPTPQDIGPADTAIATWRLKPLIRRDFGADLVFTVSVTSENVPGRKYCQDWVFVPALPYTLSLVIPNDPVTYYQQHVNVPIYVDDPEGKSINSFDFRLLFNVDQQRNPLPETLLRLDPSQPVIYDGRTLLNGWQVDVKELSTNLLSVKATSPGTYLALDPNLLEKPLLMLGFVAMFGQAPNHNSVAVSNIMWPTTAQLLDSVLINNGSIYPRVTNGTVTISGDCLRPLEAGSRFVISQNRPNPFNPSTVIRYEIPEVSPVRITVHDALGRLVRVLVDETKNSGVYEVVFHADDLPSGLYMYRMETPKYQQVMKMLLAR
ncbi:MAG: T9SS type A sorting domain-containing protein [Ignavibacteriae bacterium]|nr:T9SS type A sorting domain-containing protein [Ignavibacteriota bacterium]